MRVSIKEPATSIEFINLECGYSMLLYLAPLFVGEPHFGDSNVFGDFMAPYRDDALESFILIYLDMRYNIFKFL